MRVVQKEVITCVTSSADNRQCPRARRRALATSCCIRVILEGEGGFAWCNEGVDDDDDDDEEEEEEVVNGGNPSSLEPSVNFGIVGISPESAD